MFIDRTTFKVKAGKGGPGSVSFRREAYVPKGGPDGGNGGRGGHVIFRVNEGLGTLLDLRYRHLVSAQNGGHGSGQKRSGADGRDEIIEVPPGTMVYNQASGEVMADLTEHGREVIIAHGGRGGKGNTHFKTPTRRAPRFAQPGEAGEEFDLLLELKLIADVGLVGLPNAGKSTLLSVVSAARPEIADYPFTTLTPKLGIVEGPSWRGFVMADIPGLIEGASEGKGLGHQFLRHVERTKVLCILVEATDEEPDKSLETLLGELEAFNPVLLTRPRLIVRTKSDLEGEPWGREDLEISAVTRTNIDELVRTLTRMVEEQAAQEAEENQTESNE
ncbi:GTPase ObgE [bacterium]|nr:GTPase ObgE [bacterium]